MLEQLSAGASNAESASERCQQTLRDVQRLLHPDSLTQFKFRAPTRTAMQNDGAASSSKQAQTQLSSFARMVAESSDVPYHYLTPDSAKTQVRGQQNKARTHPQVILPTPQSRQTQAEPRINGYATPQMDQQPPSGSQGFKLQAVVVPTTLTPAQRAEYQYMSEADSHYGAQDPTPTRRNDGNLINGYRPISIDQKQKSDQAVQGLQSLLLEIFEAEDQLEPDTSGAVSTSANAVFSTRETNDGSVSVLQAEVQARLDAHVHKVVANGRLESIEIDSLVRVQRLCERTVSAITTVHLKTEEYWSDSDVLEWADGLAVVERGLVAARTLLRIMAGGSHIKELQSEDFLNTILGILAIVTDDCVVPIVEDRPSLHEKARGAKDDAPSNAKFVAASMHRKALQSLLQALNKTFRILGDFLSKLDLDESAVSKIISLCKQLLFSENASNDRDSAVGVQNFEITRRYAMDMLVKLFAKYTDQRQYVLHEILTSLEKLPASKQSARQFRLPDARPIQLISATLMRLIQTSATHGGVQGTSRGNISLNDNDATNDDDSEDAEPEDDDEGVIRVSRKQPSSDSESLIALTKPLHDAAQSNTSYVVMTLVSRAMKTTKTSDEPYRKLLDIFTEDFLSVLGSSDWPCAEMLLRTMVTQMIGLVENPKSAAPSRILALELLGVIGSGILDLQKAARKALSSLEVDANGLSLRLRGMVEQLETGDLDFNQLAAFDGPYRVVVEYLQARDRSDAQLRSAQGYHIMQWAFNICGSREGSTDSDTSDGSRAQKDLQRTLSKMVLDPQWLEEHSDISTPSTAQGHVAAFVITLSSKLCKAFNRIFSTLLMSMSNEQPTVKSRGSKSVSALLEKDASILDRNNQVVNHIIRGMSDASPLVRDSMLKLLGDCLAMRPSLDRVSYERIIIRTSDAAPGVRKRAMKMLKDIYLRNDSVKLRSEIADAIIVKANDSEESVNQLARQTIEEIWFTPFQGLSLDGERSVAAKVRYSAQAALLITTLETGEGVSTVLEALIRELLRSKSASAYVNVCNALVRILFDGIIDSSDIPGTPGQPAILRCLAVFAKASPTLFTASQLERLEPYTQNLSRSDDLEVYRSAITILRYVMPHLSTMKPDFLQKLQTSLLASVSKLPKTELSEVIPCLWTINGMLGNTERLINFLASVLKGVHAAKNVDFAANPAAVNKTSRLMVIAGHVGNACALDDHVDSLRAIFSWYKGETVSGLIAELLCPFTSPKQPLEVRESALEGLCMISQASPKLFLRTDVVNAFETVFKDRMPSLEEVLLAGLEGFFTANESNAGGADAPSLGSGIASGNERLGRTYVATDHDGASTSIAQRFLPQILRLALKSVDDTSLLAAKVIVSINRQGLVHPKESGPALVALETCPNSAIANMAFVEHKAMHSKHESLFDKEYMRAVQQAYEYQKSTIGNTSGCSGHPPVSKLNLTWEVLKSGKAQVRKKFLTNMCQKMDFSLASFAAEGKGDVHREYARFCTENLALFDYDRIEELAHLLAALEKIFSGTGSAVAQAIESEVLKLHIDMAPTADGLANGTTGPPTAESHTPYLDPQRLRQLAIAAQVCSMIWETRGFLRNLWNMEKYLKKPKSAAKEASRAPNRSTMAPALTESYIHRMAQTNSAPCSLDSERSICAAFAEMISVDSEVKVGSDDENDANGEDGYETPSERASNKSNSVPPSGGGRDRKRKSASRNATPRKKGRQSMDKRRSSAAKLAEEDNDNGDWA